MAQWAKDKTKCRICNKKIPRGSLVCVKPGTDHPSYLDQALPTGFVEDYRKLFGDEPWMDPFYIRGTHNPPRFYPVDNVSLLQTIAGDLRLVLGLPNTRWSGRIYHGRVDIWDYEGKVLYDKYSKLFEKHGMKLPVSCDWSPCATTVYRHAHTQKWPVDNLTIGSDQFAIALDDYLANR
jgi:hypothetical protein